MALVVVGTDGLEKIGDDDGWGAILADRHTATIADCGFLDFRLEYDR